MLNKEECEHALARFYGNGRNFRDDCELFFQLIQEHFEPLPYKFEELDEGMYVYDYETEEILLIEYTTEVVRTGEKLLYCWQFKNEQGMMRIKFEENRFYPVTKAMQYQGKEDE